MKPFLPQHYIEHMLLIFWGVERRRHGQVLGVAVETNASSSPQTEYFIFLLAVCCLQDM